MNTITTTGVKIEIGKRYVLRNGIITDEIKQGGGTNYIFEATIKEPEYNDKSVACWLYNGSYLTTAEEHRNDIVSEFNPCLHENIDRKDGLDQCLDCGVRNY